MIFWAWVAPGPRTRVQALSDDGRALFTIVIGLVFALLVSGIIEGYVTRQDWPWPIKIGIGTIALTAAKKAKSVAGVELSADAVRNARHNARMNGIENAVFACGDAGEALEGAANAGERFDVVFLDPPREGASEQFLSSLDKAAPKRAVYVSCNPETLARDLSFLKKRGWHVLRARPVDMFPHTEHVETVCLLAKK